MGRAAGERVTSKGEETRAQVLAAAVAQASAAGFESITIGTLAERTGLSKSGLFAHFGSRVELQMAALDEAARQFAESVFLPALKAPRGVKRLRALFELWLRWPAEAKLPGGCPIDSALHEYDHRPGPLRDAIIDRQRQLDRELQKAVRLAIDTGELARDTDAELLAFEMVGLVMSFYRSQHLLAPAQAIRRARAAFDHLIRSHGA
ncbi:MAG: TetR/AcrR family transcriptional regulator [Betaproteobacteria bacterium]